MPFRAYLKITGETQGTFKGGSTRGSRKLGFTDILTMYRGEHAPIGPVFQSSTSATPTPSSRGHISQEVTPSQFLLGIAPSINWSPDENPREEVEFQYGGLTVSNFITVTRQVDSASPQIFRACATNELLPAVVVEFSGAPSNGRLYNFTSITLTNASITKVGRYAGLEVVTFHFPRARGRRG
jgi:hypothetical protein